MITFHFNEAKATQAAAFLLKENGGEMNYMKLIKLLYIADREALLMWERPITGDSYFSMNKGPILSEVLDKITSGEMPTVESYWHKFISAPANYNVNLKQEPDFDELSKRESELLLNTFKKYKQHNQWAMVDICHQILPEWEHPNGTSIPIRIEDIFKALNKTELEIHHIEQEVSNMNYVKAVLSPR